MVRHEMKLKDIHDAQQAFEAKEPRDLFYRAATELVALAFRGGTSLSVVEALSVLLQTWNSSYYRYRKFDVQHFSDIDNLMKRNQDILLEVREKSIESLSKKQEKIMKDIFKDFELVLGPVGAAKCLHLLAPRLFPLWDRAIAEEYDLPLGKAGTNSDLYWQFMLISKNQCAYLGGEKAIGRNPLKAIGRNPLKAIDQYNYCKFTKEWI